MTDKSKIIKSLQSLDYYATNKSFRTAIREDDNHKIVDLSIQVIMETLGDRSATPISQLLAIRYSKDLVETFNDYLISQIQIILPNLETVALYKNSSKDEDRGKDIFVQQQDTKEIQQLGKSFLRLILECIIVWSKWFPIDPENGKLSLFRLIFGRLIFKGVSFPVLTYFQPSEVKKYLPETQVPREMLTQLRVIMKVESRKAIPTPINQLQQLITKQVKVNDIVSNLNSVKTYSNFLNDLIRRHRKQVQSPIKKQASINIASNQKQEDLQKLVDKLMDRIDQMQKQQQSSQQYQYQQQQQDQYQQFQQVQIKHIVPDQSQLLWKVELQQQTIQDQQSLLQTHVNKLSSQGQENDNLHIELQKQIQRKNGYSGNLTAQIDKQSATITSLEDKLSFYAQKNEQLSTQLEQATGIADSLTSRLGLAQGAAERSSTQATRLSEQLLEARSQLKQHQKVSQLGNAQHSSQLSNLHSLVIELTHQKDHASDQLMNGKAAQTLLQQQVLAHQEHIDKLIELNRQYSTHKDQLLNKQLLLVEEVNGLSKSAGNFGWQNTTSRVFSTVYDSNLAQFSKMSVNYRNLALQLPTGQVWYDDGKIQVSFQVKFELGSTVRTVVATVKNISDKAISKFTLELPQSKGIIYNWLEQAKQLINNAQIITCSFSASISQLPYSVDAMKLSYEGSKSTEYLYPPVMINSFLESTQIPNTELLPGLFSEQSNRIRLGDMMMDISKISSKFNGTPQTGNIQLGYFQLPFLKTSVFVSVCRNKAEFQVQAESNSIELAKTVIQHLVAMLS